MRSGRWTKGLAWGDKFFLILSTATWRSSGNVWLGYYL